MVSLTDGSLDGECGRLRINSAQPSPLFKANFGEYGAYESDQSGSRRFKLCGMFS